MVAASSAIVDSAAIGGGLAAGADTSIAVVGGSSVHSNTVVMGGVGVSGGNDSLITACASKVVMYLKMPVLISMGPAVCKVGLIGVAVALVEVWAWIIMLVC